MPFLQVKREGLHLEFKFYPMFAVFFRISQFKKLFYNSYFSSYLLEVFNQVLTPNPHAVSRYSSQM